MGAQYVALDLETTGLDPTQDAIIEVGLVRFDADGVRDTFGTLIDPRRPIPRAVQTLTGINDAAVRDAPTIGAVADEIEAFLRDATLVGHNVAGFDAQFLQAAGIRHSDSIYDTQILAELLLPGLSEYGLAALTDHFEIPLVGHHRAGVDAEATRLLFLALRDEASRLPVNVLGQIAQWVTPTAWPWRGFFRECWEVAASRASAQEFAPPRRPPRVPDALAPYLQPRTVPPEEALAVLRSARSHPDVLPQFEEREEQEAMGAAVATAFNEERQLIVEAGTGTGKSLAYLIPSACYAVANNERVLVSTATINLQEQLAKKDVPAVEALLPSDKVRSCQLKGRRNYLCLKRFDALISSAAFTDEEALMAVRARLWLHATETGDRAEIRISQPEERVWREICADGAECTAENSPFVADGSCFLQRARKLAAASHIVVVNHSLLLSDAAMGGAVLPPYRHLIIDEAHHLEEEATRKFGFSANEGAVADLFDRCERLSTHLQAALRERQTQPHLQEMVRVLRQLTDTARSRHAQFFASIMAFLGQQIEGPDQDDRLLLNRGMRVQADWADVEVAWENLRLALQSVLSALRDLRRSLSEGGTIAQPSLELITAETDALAEDVQETSTGLSAAISEEDPQRVVWAERARNDGSLMISWAPLIVSDLLREKLYAERKTLVLTGATLRTGDGFGYVQERLGLEDAQTLALGSPFDFKRAALVLTPRDMPEPSHPEYTEALARTIADLARASNGRALALFTSHATLRTTHRVVLELLERDGITVLGQGIDGSARQLVRALQSNTRTVLLGTASFWEGVDIAGEALSLLMITRLPFNVPTEPVFAARSALYDSPFDEYALPQAVLRFRQGFGRLIRTKTDKGVLVVLDQRIVSKQYGSAFLESLPGCRVQQLVLREMPDVVEQWLGAVVSQ